ncbi:glutamate--cysteine ligase [Thalassotalea profundi]|uniref:Glutamate--cysteine ligase n=1 Tax=Thalassotalea profundi TaxID=2036687 RepID=A0ABQ3IFI6_9GAMM|nr:glutamate--cysteine ligase [Thalassotalea profundi]GHE81712.1 glutamate--cysteine ligase [Thalassotalea profundi]
MSLSFTQLLSAFELDENINALTNFGYGVERETLRVLPQGKLSDKRHYRALGSSLTHPNITTDYAEPLLEFITPVSHSPEQTITQLEDIQKFTLSEINDELLWPMSMPCFVDCEDSIELAYYGESNIGKMKSVYRQGLKNRYGSMMQVIAGIHFNFSFSQDFWLKFQSFENNELPLQDYISDKYFALLRNYKRFCWLIPYLYGSSPALCPSFLKGKNTNLPFKKSPKGYVYLEYATSLRMSDLGYTNSEQSSLHICYNNLEGYVAGVQEAINLSSDKFAKIGVKVDGKYQQLNANVLQIENELYAPVRPKQVAKSGEKPSQALLNRGVEYVEVRALDVNPFSPTGIELQQVLFLEVFLAYCALKPSEELDCDQQNTLQRNMDEIVVRGRDPQLRLNDCGVEKSVQEWGVSIFEDMAYVAQLLDKANGVDKYFKALTIEKEKILNPNLTPSAILLDYLNNQDGSLTQLALENAHKFKDDLQSRDYQFFNYEYFKEQAQLSFQQQKQIEESDVLSFDDFLKEYFTK